jgi:hypothetical protein
MTTAGPAVRNVATRVIERCRRDRRREENHVRKRHIAVDTCGPLLAVLITGAVIEAATAPTAALGPARLIPWHLATLGTGCCAPPSNHLKLPLGAESSCP